MVKRLSPLTVDHDLKALLHKRINPWIKACKRSGKHVMCPSLLPYEQNSYKLPTRLMDVGTGLGSKVRLVNTSDLIASLLSKRHGVDYFAGICQSHCLSHFLWQSESPQSLPEISDNFSTWSWLSSAGEVIFGPDTSEPWQS